jgi:hypothetical protein
MLTDDHIKTVVLATLRTSAELCQRRGMTAVQIELENCAALIGNLPTIINDNVGDAGDAQKTGDISWDEFEERLFKAGFSRTEASRQRDQQQFGLLGDCDGDLGDRDEQSDP